MPVSSQTVMPCVSFFQSGTGTHGIPCRASPPLFLPGSLHNGRSLAVLHLPARCVSPSLPLWSGKGTVPDGTSPAPALPKEFPYHIFIQDPCLWEFHKIHKRYRSFRIRSAQQFFPQYLYLSFLYRHSSLAYHPLIVMVSLRQIPLICRLHLQIKDPVPLFDIYV